MLLLAAFAAAPQAEATTYYACVTKSGVAHIYTKKPKCRRSQSKLSWNNVGPAGINGRNGTNGVNGANGANGTTGFTSVLPTGQTEVGTWAGVSSGNYYDPISFNIPLASKPQLTIIGLKGAPTTECPGSPAKPEATSGNLCIYTGQLVGDTEFAFDPIVEGGAAGADVFGVIFGLSGTGYGYGTWAVTG